MKVRIYNPKKGVYYPCVKGSLYAKMNKGVKFRTARMPKKVAQALFACDLDAQLQIWKNTYERQG